MFKSKEPENFGDQYLAWEKALLCQLGKGIAERVEKGIDAVR